MQDEQIIDLYWERSEEAIRETDKKYGKYCGTIAWNILYSAEDAEECVNDTWMNAWNAMPPHRPGFLKACLGKITRNLALNLYEPDVLHNTAGNSKKIKDFCMQNRGKTVPAAWIREQFNGNTDTAVANFLGEQMERALMKNQSIAILHSLCKEEGK